MNVRVPTVHATGVSIHARVLTRARLHSRNVLLRNGVVLHSRELGSPFRQTRIRRQGKFIKL
ncbi:hypothetical protein THIX_60898 [Thiomonas sp. X19]|nr:hypothetical protein THIX_60898 [Thiomonas sp. X19]